MINVIDGMIIVILAAAAFGGLHFGVIRQLVLSVGLFGMFIGLALVYDKLAFLTPSSGLRRVILALLMLTIAFLCCGFLLDIGAWARRRLWPHEPEQRSSEETGGAIAGAITAVIMVWVAAAIFGPVTAGSSFGRQLETSRVLRVADTIGGVPPLLKKTVRLLGPFTAPDVFADEEPQFGGGALRDDSLDQHYSQLDAAVARAALSTVKITAWGCGSSSAGSGFLLDAHTVATNAHVIAGADRVSVHDKNGSYLARSIWFDPLLDVALLRTENDMPDAPLVLQTKPSGVGAIGGVLGYPGGSFQTGDAIILQQLNAMGYDIYGKTKTLRKVYALRGAISAGNSGGPLINTNGEVLGMVFGHSTSQPRTGYALTADQVGQALLTTRQRGDRAVGTGSCTGS